MDHNALFPSMPLDDLDAAAAISWQGNRPLKRMVGMAVLSTDAISCGPFIYIAPVFHITVMCPLFFLPGSIGKPYGFPLRGSAATPTGIRLLRQIILDRFAL